MYWSSTPDEIRRLIEASVRRKSAIEKSRQRAHDQRTAFIAATIFNQWVKKGKKPYTPDDFLSDPVRRKDPTDASAVQELRAEHEIQDRIEHLRAWARGVNKRNEA